MNIGLSAAAAAELEPTPAPEVANLAGAATALGATVDELLDLVKEELEEELAALKLRPLVRRRVEKEWAARQKGAQVRVATEISDVPGS